LYQTAPSQTSQCDVRYDTQSSTTTDGTSFSKDETAIAAFYSGKDEHKETAIPSLYYLLRATTAIDKGSIPIK